jgi:alpha-L-rhamnosidase
LLGRRDDEARWSELAGRVRQSLEAAFLDRSTGAFADGTQTAQAFALHHDLVPEPLRRAAFDRLVHDVVEIHGSHLTRV